MCVSNCRVKKWREASQCQSTAWREKAKQTDGSCKKELIKGASVGFGDLCFKRKLNWRVFVRNLYLTSLCLSQIAVAFQRIR